MAQEFQTSFIPKKETGSTPRKRQTSMSIFAVSGFLLFFVAVLAAGGVFLYERILERSIESKKQVLTEAQESFEPDLIRELIRLDQRLTEANTLLAEHIAPSSLFDLLEEITLETVRFETFTLSVPEGIEGTTIGSAIELQLSGSAVGFSAVALQSDEFAESPYILDPFFSNFNIAENGRVTFNVTAAINPDLFTYDPPSVSIPPAEEIEEIEGTGEENTDI